MMFYPPLLTDHDLWELLKWSVLAVRNSARPTLVPFCRWLRRFVLKETDRRKAEEPIEADMPVLPLDELSPQTIAHMALTLHCMCQETESEYIGEFADALLDVVTAANLAHATSRKD